MKTPVRIGFALALVWIIFNMILYYAGWSIPGFQIGILVNIFLLMVSVALGVYLKRKEENWEATPFLADFKSAMQAGAIYAITVCAFIYLYHEKIDPSIKNDLIAQRMVAIHENVSDKETYEKLQADDPAWQDKGYDDYIEIQEDITKSVISSSSVFLFHLLGLFFFGLFYSFFAALILRKVVLRNQ